MRERITIRKPGSGYSVDAGGDIDASGTALSYSRAAIVKKGLGDFRGGRQDVFQGQNQIENAYTFRIRNDRTITFSKEFTIDWRAQTYSIIGISDQSPHNEWISLFASSTS